MSVVLFSFVYMGLWEIHLLIGELLGESEEAAQRYQLMALSSATSTWRSAGVSLDGVLEIDLSMRF